MRLCIFGYYGFGNAGDEAVLAGILHGLRLCGWAIGDTEAPFQPTEEAAALEQDALSSIAAGRRLDVVVISGDPAATREMHNVAAAARSHGRQLWHEAGQADAWLFGGGSLLQDVTGPWTLPYYISVLQMVRLRRTPIFFHAQGIGPIQRAWQQRLAGWMLRQMKRISVRDDASAVWIDRLTRGKASVERGADPVFLLNAPSVAERQAALDRALAAADPPAGEALPTTWLGIALRPWEGLDASLPMLRQALQAVSEKTGAGVLLVPMQDAADEPIARRLAADLGPRAIVAGVGTSFRERMALLAGCTAVVGMRLHAVLFAALSGVPGIALDYDPKVSAAAQALGWPAVSLPLVDHAFISQFLQQQLMQRGASQAVQQLQATVAAERNKALSDAAGLARELVRLAEARNRRPQHH